MNIEELQERVQFVFAFVTKELIETKNASPFCQIVPREGNVQVIFLNNVDMSDWNAKRDLGLMLKRRVRECDAKAVIFVSDAFFAEIDPKFQEQAAARMDSKNFAGMSELIDRGWAKRRECIVVTVETPIYACLARQFYRRAKGGRPVLEEYEETVSEDRTTMRGNFAGFFKRERQKAV